MNIRITWHAIKRYKERIEKCSDDEAANSIMKIVFLGEIIAQKKKGAYIEKLIRKNDAVIVAYEYECNNVIVVSVLRAEYEGWWKKQASS
ncbi:hypothetical protein Calkro_0632 [Caldicellulosiruptor kronotskyensis 2002]|uniref:DUF4258 domain-containing protein n=1 Tax=Caldicellulosiruptor kronotskyensis (strain DSM 18902 / VKM B-2412 / 2002) TaxID=632348 RepID=E4SEN9_CALK2|nr:hypothetical protein [Caldicellulosiruptor kronotskyensis]ADQ45526.1 hypothetical protein Calkro_0632 [Caldicellulosiruptor kronotskyensis 2002]